MATTYLCGFEMGATTEAFSVTGTASVQTGTIRTGAYALRANPTAATGFLRFTSRLAGGTNQSIFRSARFYLRIATAPLGLCHICNLGTGSGGALGLALNTTGTLALRAGSTTRATSVSTLSTGVWYRIEFDCGWSGGSGMRVFVDGTQFASDATDTGVTTTTTADIGAITASTTTDLYFDDAVFEDAALTLVAKDYNIVMLLPTADSAVGSGWFRTDGTTATGLFNELTFRPPAGNTSATLGTGKHIKSSSATNNNYDATMTTYTAAGIDTNNDIVNAVQAVCNDAQGVTTQSPKAGAVVIVSNPSGQTETSLDFGIQQGTTGSTTAAALGVFPAGWGSHVGPVTVNPSVVMATAPVARIGKRASSTREVDCDFLGINVMYTPGGNLRNPRPVKRSLQAVNRAGTY